MSVAAQCRFSYLFSAGLEVEVPDNEKMNSPRWKLQCQKTEEESWRLFSEVSEEITDEQWRFVDAFLGISYVKSAVALRQILADAEIKYKFLIGKNSRSIFHPSYFRRRLKNVKRSIKKRLPLFFAE